MEQVGALHRCSVTNGNSVQASPQYLSSSPTGNVVFSTNSCYQWHQWIYMWL